MMLGKLISLTGKISLSVTRIESIGDMAISAWWRCSKSRSIPQRLGETTEL